MKLSPLGRDKRAITISTPTVIITILSVLVLLVVALSFTGGMRALIDKVRQVFTGTVEPPIEIARDTCKNRCQFNLIESYCHGVDISVNNANQCFDCLDIAPCEGIPQSACDDRNILSCPSQ